MVDTSEPFIAHHPTADRAMVVIRLPTRGIDFPYLPAGLMLATRGCRANTLVVPGGKMELALHRRLIFTPMITGAWWNGSAAAKAPADNERRGTTMRPRALPTPPPL